MGQYHKLVNLDKKEYVSASEIGNGRKLMEQCGFEKSTATALWLLIAASNGSAGGDAKNHEMVGRWAGDRIVIIGDDSRPGSALYQNLDSSDYTNISHAVREMLDLEFDYQDVPPISQHEMDLKFLAFMDARRKGLVGPGANRSDEGFAHD
jgi:hypothetical protein